MSAMASQITGVSIVYSTVCSGADQRNHQSSASLAFVRLIHRWPMTSPHKGAVTWRHHDISIFLLSRINNTDCWMFGDRMAPAWRSVVSKHADLGNPRLRSISAQIARFMGPTWGPGGPHIGPMNRAIREGTGRGGGVVGVVGGGGGVVVGGGGVVVGGGWWVVVVVVAVGCVCVWGGGGGGCWVWVCCSKDVNKGPIFCLRPMLLRNSQDYRLWILDMHLLIFTELAMLVCSRDDVLCSCACVVSQSVSTDDRWLC